MGENTLAIPFLRTRGCSSNSCSARQTDLCSLASHSTQAARSTACAARCRVRTVDSRQVQPESKVFQAGWGQTKETVETRRAAGKAYCDMWERKALFVLLDCSAARRLDSSSSLRSCVSRIRCSNRNWSLRARAGECIPSPDNARKLAGAESDPLAWEIILNYS